MALRIHGNRWEFIHKHYFHYRTLHSIKSKWDREKLKNENSYKKILSEWTPEEDKILSLGIEKYGRGNWRKISRMLPNKESLQVFRRFYLINYTKRGNFTQEEDNLLCDLLETYGTNNWKLIADKMNRPIYYVMYHYKFVLLNSINLPKWTDRENQLINDAILKYGKDWKKIQKLLPHRFVQSIKQHVRCCPEADPYYNSGFWKIDETLRLVEAVRIYGKKWQNVSKFVATRSPFQCRIHFRDSFTKKGLESYVLNLKPKGIQSIFPDKDEDFMEQFAAEQLSTELGSSE
ncbi:hypothetical protein C1645_739214 [Glomus cerebriforme]|uniref:Homeodomain-like protein n=1 Tax=Glomus cerebriforme TaxID=658196 RepID=A0A397SXD2_9GLOM|nr:hypothetical protein C1645_739214 [Glomus cerebriforme]